MTESQIGEYQELININLNKIKKHVNQIEPRGGNRELYYIIACLLDDIKETVGIMDVAEYKEELEEEKKQ